MSKGKTGRPWHIRWEPQEWLKVAAMAVHLIEQQQQSATDAVWHASHAVLPQHRWQTIERIKQVTTLKGHNEIWRKYAAQIGLMSAEQREQILLADIKHPKPSKAQLAAFAEAEAEAKRQQEKEQRAAERAAERAQRKANGEIPRKRMRKGAPPYKPVPPPGGIVKWTKREWALIARAAKWVSEQYPASQLWEQVVYAQQFTLADDRQRSIAGIQQSLYTGQRRLSAWLAEGLHDAWLIENIPFVPPGAETEADEETSAEELAPPPVADQPAAVTADAPPQVNPSSLATGGALPLTSLAEASKAFAETMIGALDVLLATHSRLLLDQVNTRIEASAAGMGAQVAALVASGMREAVHQMMQAELGGPVAPPEASPPVPTEAPAAGGVDIDKVHGPVARRVKIDVVGIPHGVMLHEIKKNVDEASVDVNFIHPDASYAPHRGRHLIMIRQKIPHSLSNKIKAAKIKPIFVPRATADHVTHAIDELMRSAQQ